MLGVRALEGVKDAVESAYETVPATGVAPCKVKDAWVIVAGFIFSLKVAVIIWLRGTPVAAFTGLVDTTRGHTPTISTNSSFLHPAIKTTVTIARVVNNFFVFIFFVFKFPLPGGTDVNKFSKGKVAHLNSAVGFCFLNYLLLRNQSA